MAAVEPVNFGVTAFFGFADVDHENLTVADGFLALSGVGQPFTVPALRPW
jgi:hypothetical protein